MSAREMGRLLAAGVAVAGLCALPPEVLSRGPDLCLWRHLLPISACPACGSVRALSAFFHGRLSDALAFNPNVVVTAPVLVTLAIRDTLGAVRAALRIQ